MTCNEEWKRKQNRTTDQIYVELWSEGIEKLNLNLLDYFILTLYHI